MYLKIKFAGGAFPSRLVQISPHDPSLSTLQITIARAAKARTIPSNPKHTKDRTVGKVSPKTCIMRVLQGCRTDHVIPCTVRHHLCTIPITILATVLACMAPVKVHHLHYQVDYQVEKYDILSHKCIKNLI